ncbi:MAG TPA: hypothetical protein VF290_27345 [Pyrinomonadaceae bacterium]
MKRFFTLTFCTLLALSCVNRNKYPLSSMNSTMNFHAGTQAELDEGNQRINAYKEELLQQGYRLVSTSTFHSSSSSNSDFNSSSNSRKQVILDGQHGRLKQVRITLLTSTSLVDEGPDLAAGVYAAISDEQGMQEYNELYGKVVGIVTGRP